MVFKLDWQYPFRIVYAVDHMLPLNVHVKAFGESLCMHM